jgi:hypothetical protein
MLKVLGERKKVERDGKRLNDYYLVTLMRRFKYTGFV